jgi:hypothetical protein
VQQFRETACAQLAHGIGTIKFHRARADAHDVGDVLVGMAIHQPGDDIAFPPRQVRQPFLCPPAFLAIRLGPGQLVKGLVERRDKIRL